MEFVEACRQFIRTDSSPAHGSRDIVDLAAKMCADRGLEVIVESEIYGGAPQANLVARPRGVGRPPVELMLQSHLDTHDPGPYPAWAKNGHNPFDAHIIDGRVFGLGAAGGKLDFLCKLEALSSLASHERWKLAPVLVGTFGSATGMAGALKMIRKNMVFAKMALIGEPTDLKLVTAAQGMAHVEITLPFSDEETKYRQEHDLRESTATQSRLFHGRAGEDDAISKMLSSLENLPENVVIMEIDGGQSSSSRPVHAFLEIEVARVRNPMAPRIRKIAARVSSLAKEFLSFRDEEFEPPHPQLNLGLIRTQSEGVQIQGTCWLPPVINQSVYEGWMEELRSVCSEQGGEFRVLEYKKPFRTMGASILVKGALDELREMGLHDRPGTQSTANEASLFSRTGVECVCFGPGTRDGNVQTPEESVSIDDLKRATDFYGRVLRRFCT